MMRSILGMMFGGADFRNVAKIAPAAPMPQFQVREEFVTERYFDGQSYRIRIIGKRTCQSRHGFKQRLTSRGKGGKQAHRFTGIAAARRAARKGR